MKNTLFRYSLLLALAVCGAVNAWGGDNCDFLHKEADDVWIKYVTDAGTTTKNIAADKESDIALGSITNLSISEFRAITKKHDGNVCHVKMNYGINTSRDGSKGSNVQAEYNNSGYGDWTWDSWWSVQQFKNTSVGIDLIRNRKPGNYYFDFYFAINGNSGGTSGCYDDQKYWNNNGGNYHISYTIPDPTITINGAGSLVAGTSTNIQASISNYPVGATLTRVDVTGNLASSLYNTGTGTSVTVSSVTPNASGTNGITVTVTVTYGSAGTKTYTYYYNVSPPATSEFTITPSGGGYLNSGSGTSGSPYLVTYNGTITFGLSGATKAYADGNASAQYSTDGTNYGTTGTYISKSHTSVTQTTNQNWVYKARLKNNSSALYGTVKEKTVYWKVSTSSVKLNKNGGSTDGSATATHGKNSLTSISAPTKTGYHVEGYYTNAACTTKVATPAGALQASTTYTTSTSLWNVLGAQTLYTKWTANQYTLTLNKNGGSNNGSVKVTYDSNSTSSFAAVTRAGYNCTGYWTLTSGGYKVINSDGSLVDYSASISSYLDASGNWINTSTPSFNAQWTPKTCTVNFNFDESDEGYGNKTGATTSTTATYDAGMNSVTPPTAANGWAFMGYYDAADGAGTQYYDGTGASAHNWNKDTESATTLYAFYKKAEITALTFDAVTVAPGGTVGVTPTVSPTPVEPTKICWELRYTNDNPLASQPTMTWSAGKLTFTAPTTSGAYKIVATLKTGTDCAGGTELSTASAIFQVAGDHTVTIRYQDASGNTLKASTSVTGRPLAWSDDITAPSIFGYTFARWEAGDGVTIKNGDSDPVTTSTDATIKVKAVYDGNLTAVYNQKNIIYFKNTLGWSDVYVNLLSNSKWGYQGTGNNDNYYARNLHMTRIGDSDVWYYEYGNTSTSTYVSFTNLSQENYVGFSGGSTSTPIKVCYPTIPNPINSTTEMPYFGFYSKTPMFVPNPNYPGDDYNGNLAKYYSSGYWTKYTPGTGYYLRIYDPNNSETLIKKIEFVSEDDLIPMTVTVDLEANKTYYFEISREDQQYYSNGDNTMNYDDRYGQGVAWELYRPSAYKKTKFATTAAGDYIFHLTHGNNGSGVWRLRIAAEYPIGNQDYRLIYKDNVHTAFKPSAIITKKANSKDTVSFFVRPNNNPILYKQTATVNGSTGAITWTTTETNLITAAMKSSVITQDSVYNFNLVMNGVGALSVGDVKAYTGNYYIRTDAANNKWDNYRAADHAMTYSEYAVKNSDYSHYFMAHVNSGTNVKCVIANDYSPCISDTVIRQTYRGGDASHVGESGNIAANANVRFMWNRHDNAVYRAYLADAQSDGTKFLVLRANSSTDMMDAGGNALINSANSGQAGYNHKAPDNSIQFVDNENWIYETAVKIKPGAFVKLYAYFNSAYFYFKGTNDNTFDASHAINLMTGTGDAVLVRVVYDFKTDRLLAAWQPSGDINTEREINADVMFVREHQGDITQLTFSGSGAIKKITTAYGVLRFNKWTLNNKDKSTHAVLNPPLSRYERDLYYVSFPFRVAMNEVFGFGTYGKHWIIEYYDGAGRAEKGFWSDSPSFWKFVTDRNGKYFEPNQGYIIALDLDELGESSEVWANNVENVELYFPSYGTMPTITNSSVTHALPSHECTINRETPDGNRTIKDSHWNIMSVPTYVNTSSIAFPNTDWTATRPGYLYEWNSSDNSLTARSGTDYTYHAMHAYTVQYFGNVTWSSTSVSPSSIVARRTYAEVPKNVEFRLELSQNEQMIDQTFVKLSDDEDVSEGFAFGEDMSKEFNKTRSNIYTFIGTEQVAGNTMPMSEQTTVVPVGVKIETNGDYTFSMPDGTSGIGVTLVDTETSIRTSLSALDYTIDLSAGTYDERFWLEISPISQTPTGVDDVTGDGSQVTSARKVLIDGILYIVKDDALYDARGSRVK